MNIRTKDPFEYPGLAVSVKSGVNHVNQGAPVGPSPYIDLQARYAHSWNETWAFKVTGRFLRGKDWLGEDMNSTASYDPTYFAGTNNDRFPNNRLNPGYDGVNVYGDAISLVVDSAFTASNFNGLAYKDGPTRISRNGYKEVDIANNNTQLRNLNTAIIYRPSPDVEVEVGSRLGSGTTVLQATDRFQIEDFLYHQHYGEVRGEHWFARAYASFEDAGNSYDTRFAGIGVERAWKSDNQWFAQYLFAYGLDAEFGGQPINTNALMNSLLREQPGRTPVPANDHAAARAFANSDNRALYDTTRSVLQLFGFENPDQFANLLTGGEDRIEPGTEEFETTLDSVKSTPLVDGGAQFLDKTWFYQSEAQYDFSHLLGGDTKLTGGLNLRQFFPNSEGTFFGDTAGINLSKWEYGLYGQIEQPFLDERLTVQTSLRMDQSKFSDPLLSPRAAVVAQPWRGRPHHFRLSGQRAYRMPSTQELYDAFDAQLFISTGGIDRRIQDFNLRLPEGQANTYTAASVSRFKESANQDTAALEAYQAEPVRPEQLTSFSAGYRGVLFEHLRVDAEYYYVIFRNFINRKLIVGPDRQNPGEQGNRLTPADIANDNFRNYNFTQNIDRTLYSHGASLGLRYALPYDLELSGSYNYNTTLFGVTPAEFPFNTPEHKAKLGLGGQQLLGERVSFRANARWTDAFLNKAVGTEQAVRIPARWTLDAQVTYHIKEWNTNLTLGGTNLTNNRYRDIFAGPTIGSLYYLQVSYDSFLN
jgi:hypothetical protein